MNKKLVSVIIPTYKTEIYVDQAIKSVLTQTYPDLEIILVDDGSPDRCPEILDGYAERYERVRVIHQENQGLGAARNTGFDASKGDYVFFLDSDDMLDGKEAIRNLVNKAVETDADITMGNFRRFYGNEIQGVNEHHLRDGEYTQTADFRFEGFYRFGHLAYDWGKLYKKSFLVDNDIRCCRYRFTQDKPHNMLCYVYHPKYAFIENSVYLYRENPESVTYRYKEDMIPVWISIATDFHDELQKRGLEDSCRDITAFHIFVGAFFIVKQELISGRGLFKAHKAIRKYAKAPFVKRTIGELAKGKYVRDISCVPWKVSMRLASILFAMHGYFLFTLGLALLRGLQVDVMITNIHNKSQQRKRNRAFKKTGVSPQVSLLCDLMKQAFTGEEVNSIKIDRTLLEQAIDLAESHRVLPMLYDVLVPLQEQIPEKSWKKVENATERTVKQSYRLLFLTKEIQQTCEDARIPVVVLKGSGVAAYYPVPEYRKSGDVDLLFDNMDDIYAAGKELEKLHYVKTEEQHANHHLVYQGTEGIDIELHAMLAEPFDNERTNQRMNAYLPYYLRERRKTQSMGMDLWTTSEPLQALELLLHMLQHFLRAGFGLKLLADWVVFWNKVNDPEKIKRFCFLAEDCGVDGFAKAITLLCEKFLGLNEVHIYGEHLEAEFSKGYAEQFLMEIISAEEFGKSDKNRMVALRKRGLFSYIKEFHYQMRMNYAQESKHKWKWPYLWCKTFVTFIRNNRRLGRGSLRSILKSAGERASVVEEMRLFQKKR
ncbi:MAG: glycosyltransferase [Acetatifactor sp.]|nr:glycosyltransferase [Acetatifactor sp.]